MSHKPVGIWFMLTMVFTVTACAAANPAITPPARETPLTSILTITGDTTPFKYPVGIALDSQGNIYVMDGGNSRVVVFDKDGKPLRSWGSQGNGDGQFAGPQELADQLAVDMQDQVYVVDAGDHRIQKFTSGGTFITAWTAPASVEDSETIPLGITVDGDGNVYVLYYNDFAADRAITVQKFDSTGNLLLQWGDQAGDIVKFERPLAIFADNKGHVHIADSGVIYTFDGKSALLNRFSVSSVNGQFAEITGLAMDTAGNFYLTDGPHSRVLKIDPNGNVLGAWGSEGSDPGQFFRPFGITLDAAGRVYVVEYENHRLQVLSQD